MREIKFRAWLDYGNGDGEMLPNIQNHIKGKWAFGHIVNGSVENVSAPMQYTGLKDKNGVEIYEGDILDCEDFLDESYLMIVKFDGRGGFIAAEQSNDNDFLYLDDLDFFVIGNIHENPELLS